MFAAPVERDSLLWALWQQTVKPLAVQVLYPQALGSRPLPPRLGSPSGRGLNRSSGGPSGAGPHARAKPGPEDSGGRSQGQQGWQAGEVGLGHPDTGALQEQDAARHEISNSQAQQQHLSALQEALQPVVRRRHPVQPSPCPQWKDSSWTRRDKMGNLPTTS